MEEDIKKVETNYKNFIAKNKKSENDIYNNIREDVILTFIKYYNNDNFKLNDESKKLYDNFCQTLKDNKIDNITEYEHIGGRNNKDYHLRYMNNNIVKEVDFEFKNGTLSMDKLPQFMALYTNNTETKITTVDYHKFYFDNYLDKIIQYLSNNKINIVKPLYQEYLKDLNDSKKDTFHKELYQHYKNYRTGINNIVKESISDFLEKYGKVEYFNLDSFNKKLEQQKNKVYLLTQNGKFKIDSISNYMKVISFKNIKNKNTVVFNTINNAELHCLLRWKNGNGCRGPAWQIKLVK